MKLHMYSVHDRLMNVYLAPFMARGDVDACRQITASLKDPQMSQSAIVLSPSDYDLVLVGDFDDETGIVSSFGTTVVKPIRELAEAARTVSS